MSEIKDTSAESATTLENAQEVTTMPDGALDLDARIAGFNSEFPALLGKYELGLGAEARIADGRIIADPKLFDARKKADAEKSSEPIA